VIVVGGFRGMRFAPSSPRSESDHDGDPGPLAAAALDDTLVQAVQPHRGAKLGVRSHRTFSARTKPLPAAFWNSNDVSNGRPMPCWWLPTRSNVDRLDSDTAESDGDRRIVVDAYHGSRVLFQRRHVVVAYELKHVPTMKHAAWHRTLLCDWDDTKAIVATTTAMFPPRCFTDHAESPIRIDRERTFCKQMFRCVLQNPGLRGRRLRLATEDTVGIVTLPSAASKPVQLLWRAHHGTTKPRRAPAV